MKIRTVLLAFSLGSLAVDASAAAKCNRACLSSVLDQYVGALLKHDPAGAPLAANLRFTENADVLKAGEGLWKTATALGKLQRRYVDAVNGQAVYFGHVVEGDATNIATLRIRVVDKKITEAEHVVGRRIDGMFNPDGLTANPPLEKPIDKASRSSRATMVAAANSYFDGIQFHDSAKVLGTPGCERIENGVMTAGPKPGPAPVPSLGGGPPVKGDCGSFMEDFKATIAEVKPRRYPVVDEEAGVVLGMVVFNRPPGAKRQDGSAYPRNLLTEIFVIEKGRIKGIYAAMHYMTPDNPDAPGWK